MKAPGVTYFWRHKAPFERASYLGGSKKEHSETLFPAFLETKYQFPRQSWNSLKFSLKRKIFNENSQMVRDVGEGGKRQQNFKLFIIANLLFIKFQTKNKVPEVNLCQL